MSVIQAVRDRLQALDVRRLAVATPYTDDLTGRVTAALDDIVDVVAVANLGLTDNRRIGDTAPGDAVFISCTNSRAAEALHGLRDVLGVPVTSSNDATLRAVLGRLAAAA